MKSLRALLLIALATTAQAADTTAPTLEIQHSWVEKVSGKTTFKMLLDPNDDTGFTPASTIPLAGAIQFRSKLNSTTALPDNTPWETYPWVRGRAFEKQYNATSVIIEIRAIDAAGNVSPLQRRTFASPFPLSTAPNLEPQLAAALPFSGPAIDCRGLFSMDFDGQGVGDDIMQIDRTTGRVDVRRQGTGGNFTTDTLQLSANSINDSAVADFNGDGRPDLAVVVDDTLKVFRNDGVVGGSLQFTETPPAAHALTATGITTVLHVAVGDITGEGKPEIIISGIADDGMGSERTRVAWLLNNYQFYFDAANHALPNEDTGAGRLGVGDTSGDGWADVVMADPDNNELVLFQNKANGSLAGDTDVEVALRPYRAPLGYALDNLDGVPAQSLVVGDVTGDGRADAVVTLHYFGVVGASPPADTRDHQYWQLFEGRPPQSDHRLYANSPYLVGEKGPVAAASTPFKSHVVLQDLNGDRFPEIVLTSQFPKGVTTQPAGGVEAVRVTAQLNEVNLMTNLSFTQTSYNTGVANPHRLAAGRFNTNEKRDILVANGAEPQLCWVFNVYTPITKTSDIQGGAYTSSDLGGTPGPNGTYTYHEYPGGGDIFYTVTYTNNTATALTGAVIEAALPAEFQPVVTAMDGGTISGTGAARVVRWTENVPAYSTGVKSFQVRLLATAKVGASLAPKISLKQGTKILASSTLPVVKVVAPNLTVVPASPGQPWSFTFKPFAIPVGTLVTGIMQTSVNGTAWTTLPPGIMTHSNGVYTQTSSNVPTTARFFRAALFSMEGYKYSSVFSNALPPTTDFKVSTKSPPKSGQTWTFSATQTSTAANVSVRFQSTTTPYVEGSWTDLPAYSAVTRAGNKWTFNTYNTPSGTQHYRAISAAPGWVDSISDFIGPVTVAASPQLLAPFSFFHIDFVDPARHGNPAVFYATTPAVTGLSVRFQSKLTSEDDSKWTDLPDGKAALVGGKWTLKTSYMPVGDRNWRAISEAPGYTGNTTQVYTFEVLPALLPQMPTYFGSILSPVDLSVQKTGIIPFSLTLFDFNGVQKVSVEYATPGQAFKPIANTNMTVAQDGITYSTNLSFSGSGTYLLRAAVVDGYTVSQTMYSNYVTITVGLGGGTQSPTIGTINPTLVQPKATARGSIKLTCRIGDDKQVYQVFLHRLTAEGQYSSTVGEMTKVGTSNPSDYTFTHTNLLADDYYYRVVAKDYDLNETVSGSTPRIRLNTPEVPPSPVTIDIPKPYRLVGPTVPKGKYNHAYMPYPDQGVVEFNYSGFPAGTSQVYVYKVKDANGAPVFLTSEQSYWWQNITKSSGTFLIPAPFWNDDKTHPFEGEGTYRVVASKGGVPLTHGAGVNEFTVGHAWNLPNTFTTLDYGLYWFKDGKNALRGVSVNQNDDYFAADRPTVIYVHGWQPGEVAVKRREGWSREDVYKKGVTYDDAKIWKDRGYNVGLFNWNQFGDQKNEGLIASQTNIYGGRILGQIDFLPAGHSMIYSIYGLDDKKKPTGNLYADLPGQLSTITNRPSTIMGKNVCDLFFDELERCMEGYVPGPAKEFRVIGHSLGTQVVGKTMWDVLKDPGRGVPVPTRICLLEIAQVNVGTIIPAPNEGFTVNEIQTAFISELVDHGVALEAYQSTDLASYLGATLSKVGAIHDMAAYARVRPDHISPLDPASSHNDIPRWYFESKMYQELPAWTYWTYFVKRENIGKALSASSPDSWVRTLMGSQFWYEQSEGKNTLIVNDDAFELRNGRNEPPRKSWWGL